jgi:signal transduction protein with GAF and PtsI domain
VVLDLQLPDLHGLEVFRRMRVERPDLRVVILSAHTDQENVLEALRLGAFDYLAKPLHEEELILAVRRALETWRIAAGWSDLRKRLRRLETTLEDMWARVRGGEGREDVEGFRAYVVQAVADVLGAEKTSMLLLDEEAGELRVAAAQGHKLRAEEMDAVLVGEGVAGAALARSEPLLVEDVTSDDRFSGRVPGSRYQSNSFAVAPILAGARALGVLCATDRRGEVPFGEDDLSLLRILSVQIGQMLDQSGKEPLEPAEHEDAVAVRSGSKGVATDSAGEAAPPIELDLARAICEAITAEVEPARILDAALRSVADRLVAAPVSLFLTDQASGELRREAECDRGVRSDRGRLPAGLGLTGTVFETGSLIASEAPEEDPRFDPEVDTPADGRSSPLLCGPLRFRGKTLGVFRVFPEAAGAASAQAGEVLAAALSAAVRNVLLYRSLVETIEEVAQARKQSRAR